MSRTLLLGVCLAVLCIAAATGMSVAQDEVQFVRGEPDLDVYVPDATLTPGTTTEFTVQIANDGEVRAGAVAQRERVTTARAVTVEVRERRSPLTVETRRQSIGSVPDGEMREVPITVTVPEDAEPGEYSLDVRLRYSHTFQYSPRGGVTQERTRTTTERIDVTIDDSPRFDLRTVDSDVQAGDSGTVVTAVTNVGGEPARDITVDLESVSDDVTLGQTGRNAARIDRLDAGENATLSYDVTVRADASIRNLTLDGAVRFTDADGIQGTQDGLSVGLLPEAEQAFALSVDESTLRVGEAGTLHGTVRNDGPADVHNVVLDLGEAQFEPRSATYAIGDLASGESADFRFRGTVPTEADAVPQRFDLTTRYRTTANNDRTADDAIHVPVAERRDAVVVTATETEFVAGEEGVLELAVTNQRDIDIRDVRLRLTAEEPVSSEFRTTVITSLQPGATDRVAFDLEIDSDAPRSQFPVTVDVDYLDHENEQNTARSSTVAVVVTETDRDDLPVELVIFGVLVILVAAGGWWFYAR
ncbi:COG1361 S-layer family protein [Halorubrum vacuolatum]|uniref:Conserved repeat domain-containing protein n=1 Tax=Halorubrum vacuolatum TaxID=63740 RepID=A0A238XIM1_HALVU|nr:hypothetical protein [Halorubrum vacuolatum]SNR58552.1 conserved repeat domain-containing protein [Halorubrum vacuolatum]